MAVPNDMMRWKSETGGAFSLLDLSSILTFSSGTCRSVLVSVLCLLVGHQYKESHEY